MGSERSSWLDQDAVQSLATFFLTSTDPISFLLGLGVQIILWGQRISSSMQLKPQNIAQALHGIVERSVQCEKETMLFVTACTAKEVLNLDLSETEDLTTLRRFFSEVIQINTFPFQCSDELREYTRLRSDMFDHKSSLRLAFPAPINIWLFLHDIDALAVRLSTTKTPIHYDTARKLGDELCSTGSFFRLLTKDLWIESPEALNRITEGFNLYGQMVMVSQGLEMTVTVGRHSAFYDSISVLRDSLALQMEEYRVFAMN